MPRLVVEAEPVAVHAGWLEDHESLYHLRASERQRVDDTDDRLVVVLGQPPERGSDVLQLSAQELLPRVANAGEARLHLAVDFVRAAAADGVVGVVLHQEFPGVLDQTVRVRTSQEKVRVG